VAVTQRNIEAAKESGAAVLAEGAKYAAG